MLTAWLSVAIDVGPTIGATTGIGRFVSQLIDALAAVAEPPALRRYVLSFRARLPEGVQRLPYPAGPTLRAWGRSRSPASAGARWPAPTSSTAPTTSCRRRACPSVVTVHDCSFLTRPDLVNGTVRAFAPALQRAVDRGAWVHTPSAFVGQQVGRAAAARPASG